MMNLNCRKFTSIEKCKRLKFLKGSKVPPQNSDFRETMWKKKKKSKRVLFIKCFCVCLYVVCEEMLHKKRAYQLATENNTTAQDEKFRSLKFNFFLYFSVFWNFFSFFESQQLMGHAHILVLVFYVVTKCQINSVLHIYIHKFFHIVFYLSFIFLERLCVTIKQHIAQDFLCLS